MCVCHWYVMPCPNCCACIVNGVLIGSVKAGGSIDVTDAVPFFQGSLSLAPMLEIALEQVLSCVVCCVLCVVCDGWCDMCGIWCV